MQSLRLIIPKLYCSAIQKVTTTSSVNILKACKEIGEGYVEHFGIEHEPRPSGKMSIICKVVPIRWSSYAGSKPVGPANLYTDFEVSKCPEEWKYVERLLQLKTVPEPKLKAEYPSGWQPSTEKALTYSYYIERNRNYMFPLYLKIRYRGTQRTTMLKRIRGDIWVAEDELKKYVEDFTGKNIRTQVNEVCGYIAIRGDFVTVVEEWLKSKGF